MTEPFVYLLILIFVDISYDLRKTIKTNFFVAHSFNNTALMQFACLCVCVRVPDLYINFYLSRHL